MSDIREIDFLKKSDFEYVRALDTDGNSITISKHDFIQACIGSIKDAIKIGGRNIAKNTKLQSDSWWWVGSGMELTVGLKAGDKVLISWFVNQEQAGGATIWISKEWGDDDSRTPICSTDSYLGYRNVFLWTVDKDYEKGHVFSIGGNPSYLTSVSELMFELNATIASGWMPSPEEMLNV